MKNFNKTLMIAALTLAPMFANAQWSAVRFDSSNTFTRIYAATPNDVFVIGNEPTSYDNFFLRTGDGGTTWDSIALNTGVDDFEMYEIHFPDANNGFIGGRKNNANQAMLKTVDNGTTWTEITPDPSSIETISSIYFLDANAGWATSGQNLYITINGGTSWTTVDVNFIPQDIYFANTLDGYAAGGDTMSSPALVMKTVDGGLTWTPVLTNTDWNVFVNSNNNLNVVDANTIWVSQDYTNKLFRTLDGGATWDTIVCDSVMQVLDFHFTSADSGQVLSAMGQIYYTNDAGATWSLAYATAWGFYGPSVFLYSLSFSGNTGFVCGSNGLIKRFEQNVLSVTDHLSVTGSMNVYPSPCYGAQIITIESSGMSGDCNLTIINNLGQVVHSETIENKESHNSVELFNTKFAAGIYSVVLTNETQKQSSKLIVAD